MKKILCILLALNCVFFTACSSTLENANLSVKNFEFDEDAEAEGYEHGKKNDESDEYAIAAGKTPLDAKYKLSGKNAFYILPGHDNDPAEILDFKVLDYGLEGTDPYFVYAYSTLYISKITKEQVKEQTMQSSRPSAYNNMLRPLTGLTEAEVITNAKSDERYYGSVVGNAPAKYVNQPGEDELLNLQSGYTEVKNADPIYLSPEYKVQVLMRYHPVSGKFIVYCSNLIERTLEERWKDRDQGEYHDATSQFAYSSAAMSSDTSRIFAQKIGNNRYFMYSDGRSYTFSLDGQIVNNVNIQSHIDKAKSVAFASTYRFFRNVVGELFGLDYWLVRFGKIRQDLIEEGKYSDNIVNLAMDGTGNLYLSVSMQYLPSAKVTFTEETRKYNDKTETLKVRKINLDKVDSEEEERRTVCVGINAQGYAQGLRFISENRSEEEPELNKKQIEVWTALSEQAAEGVPSDPLEAGIFESKDDAVAWARSHGMQQVKDGIYGQSVDQIRAFMNQTEAMALAMAEDIRMPEVEVYTIKEEQEKQKSQYVGSVYSYYDFGEERYVPADIVHKDESGRKPGLSESRQNALKALMEQHRTGWHNTIKYSLNVTGNTKALRINGYNWSPLNSLAASIYEDVATKYLYRIQNDFTYLSGEERDSEEEKKKRRRYQDEFSLTEEEMRTLELRIPWIFPDKYEEKAGDALEEKDFEAVIVDAAAFPGLVYREKYVKEITGSYQDPFKQEEVTTNSMPAYFLVQGTQFEGKELQGDLQYTLQKRTDQEGEGLLLSSSSWLNGGMKELAGTEASGTRKFYYYLTPTDRENAAYNIENGLWNINGASAAATGDDSQRETVPGDDNDDNDDDQMDTKLTPLPVSIGVYEETITIPGSYLIELNGENLSTMKTQVYDIDTDVAVSASTGALFFKDMAGNGKTTNYWYLADGTKPGGTRLLKNEQLPGTPVDAAILQYGDRNEKEMMVILTSEQLRIYERTGNETYSESKATLTHDALIKHNSDYYQTTKQENEVTTAKDETEEKKLQEDMKGQVLSSTDGFTPIDEDTLLYSSLSDGLLLVHLLDKSQAASEVVKAGSFYRSMSAAAGQYVLIGYATEQYNYTEADISRAKYYSLALGEEKEKLDMEATLAYLESTVATMLEHQYHIDEKTKKLIPITEEEQKKDQAIMKLIYGKSLSDGEVLRIDEKEANWSGDAVLFSKRVAALTSEENALPIRAFSTIKALKGNEREIEELQAFLEKNTRAPRSIRKDTSTTLEFLIRYEEMAERYQLQERALYTLFRRAGLDYENNKSAFRKADNIQMLAVINEMITATNTSALESALAALLNTEEGQRVLEEKLKSQRSEGEQEVTDWETLKKQKTALNEMEKAYEEANQRLQSIKTDLQNKKTEYDALLKDVDTSTKNALWTTAITLGSSKAVVQFDTASKDEKEKAVILVAELERMLEEINVSGSRITVYDAVDLTRDEEIQQKLVQERLKKAEEDRAQYNTRLLGYLQDGTLAETAVFGVDSKITITRVASKRVSLILDAEEEKAREQASETILSGKGLETSLTEDEWQSYLQQILPFISPDYGNRDEKAALNELREMLQLRAELMSDDKLKKEIEDFQSILDIEEWYIAYKSKGADAQNNTMTVWMAEYKTKYLDLKDKMSEEERRTTIQGLDIYKELIWKGLIEPYFQDASNTYLHYQEEQENEDGKKTYSDVKVAGTDFDLGRVNTFESSLAAAVGTITGRSITGVDTSDSTSSAYVGKDPEDVHVPNVWDGSDTADQRGLEK